GSPPQNQVSPRAVVDHDVDRGQVEAQQCVKLSPTNRSIGLITAARPKAAPPRTAANTKQKTDQPAPPEQTKNTACNPTLETQAGFDDLVAMARGDPPDPIPNSAVKSLSADGTAS